MDYSLITEEAVEERFASLPDHIQTLLASEQPARLVTQIGKSHFLGREKVEGLQQIVTLILLGFVNLRDLKQELSEQLFLNYTNTVSLAKELEAEIFAPIRNELEQIYEPVEAGSAEETPEVPETAVPTPIEEPADGSFTIPVSEVTAPDAPLMLHSERSVASASVGQGKFGDLSKAFSFFRPKVQAAERLVAAAVEVPKAISEKRDDKKVVHYTELRTSITPFGQPEDDFINLESFDRASGEKPTTPKPVSIEEQPAAPKPIIDAVSKAPEKTAAEATPTPAPAPIPVPATTPTENVTLDGNRIDLRAL